MKIRTKIKFPILHEVKAKKKFTQTKTKKKFYIHNRDYDII